MKDSLALLATALAFAFLASLFWQGLGEDSFAILGLLTMTALTVDNFCLRRKLKALNAKSDSPD
ncbi:hypothetical protein TRP66_07940 [Pseudomonas sp. JDS28PS106]|uniref:hypothetical protein n=1 Tax=Pseudomonas sp. JDS28PS106 TaxID=2497235 RepID=UPI002FD45F11